MLTPDQLTEIDQHLRRNLYETKWFQQEEFVAEITDHYVNSISERMAQGESFQNALANTYTSFGERKGLMKLELTYWKLSARESRKSMLRYALNCFSFPAIFITAPAIILLLIVRINFAWVFSRPEGSSFFAFFEISLWSQLLTSLVAWLFTKRAHHFGPFQPLVQRLASPARKLNNWVTCIYFIEMVASPLIMGKASPYVASLLYIISVLLHLSYRNVTKVYARN